MRHDTGNFMRRYEMRERAALMGGRVVIRVGQIQHRRRGMGYDERLPRARTSALGIISFLP